MDYPKSVPSVGLVNGKFVDENPATGMPGSLIPASWGNAVTEEVLNVIRAAGGAPDENRSDQLWQALRLLGVGQRLPITALPKAVVQTVDGRLQVSPVAVATSGGKVSIPAGVPIALGESFGDGALGRVGSFISSAWSSADLAPNSTYFVRAQVVAGEVNVYLQQGTVYDSVPTLLKGSAGASSGGGFPSTALDLCLAWVRTWGIGSVPSVVEVYNHMTSLWTQNLNGSGVLYLPMDHTARGARLHAANPAAHPTDITGLWLSSTGGVGWNYSCLNPTAVSATGYDGWGSPAGFGVFTSNVLNDVSISNLNVSFDHGLGRSLWNVFQAEHTYGVANAASDELLLGMAIRGHSVADYQTGIAVNFSNAVNLQLAWELIR